MLKVRMIAHGQKFKFKLIRDHGLRLFLDIRDKHEIIFYHLCSVLEPQSTTIILLKIKQ